MNSKRTRLIVSALVMLLLFFAGTTLVTAQTSNGYNISWWTTDGGGGTSQSADGQYTLNGTIGQPEIGTASGNGFEVGGGFWGEGILHKIRNIFLPLIMR